MKRLELLESIATPDGRLTLHQRGGDFMIQLEGEDLMCSRLHGSEEALAWLAIAEVGVQGPLAVLVGGLGMGFTLRAALGALDGRRGSTVTVAEYFAAVVDWNHKVLGPLADYPLEDPRTRVRVVDVRRCLHPPGAWDVILLDVDNGPAAFTLTSNEALYDRPGLERLHAALTPGGVLATWSAGPDPAFLRRMRAAGFDARSETVAAASQGPKGGNHTIFIGRRS